MSRLKEIDPIDRQIKILRDFRRQIDLAIDELEATKPDEPPAVEDEDRKAVFYVYGKRYEL